jgi:hypothetical protein
VAGAGRQGLDRRAPHSSGRASIARAADGPSAARAMLAQKQW